MPFQIKIQPMDSKPAARGDPAKQGGRSRLKRLFERQLPSVLRIGGATSATSVAAASAAAAAAAGEERERERDEGDPSSVGLDRMVLSFIEESNDRPPRGRCNCFNGHHDDSSDDELDLYFADAPRSAAAAAVPVDAAELLKGLVPCTSVAERNLLADASKILDRSKSSKGKDNSRSLLADGLKTLGYDAAICKSRWDRTPSYPSGEHEYVDVVHAGGGEPRRLIVEVDFRSEFEIARSTKAYRAALQSLPSIFVGSTDRLTQIVSLVSDAARQSLKKKGLHFPPWRKSEYMRAKWLSPFQRLPSPPPSLPDPPKPDSAFQLRLAPAAAAAAAAAEERITVVVVSPHQPKVVTGFASNF